MKKYKEYISLTFPQFGLNSEDYRYAMSFSNRGKLSNTILGEIDILLHRPLKGEIKQLVIKSKGHGWYAIFSARKQVVPLSIDKDNAVGIRKYAVFSNGLAYEKPKFICKKERRLQKIQRKLSVMKRVLQTIVNKSNV